MGLRIPNNDELTIEQTGLINLPTNRNWVIQGGPGTGKTVMAIMRAGQLSRSKKVLYLVYNRNLSSFLEAAVKKYTNCEVKTYHQWLGDFYRQTVRSPLPELAPFTPDWSQVEPNLSKVGKKYDHIIIDEAQDFPLELIRILKNISNNMTCFVDPNQEVVPETTSSTDFIKILCEKAPYPLKYNFRNTAQIRDVIALFCVEGNPEDVKRGTSRGEKPIIKKLPDYNEQLKYMADLCRQMPGQTIGIIVNNQSLNITYNGLYKELEGQVTVQMSKAGVHGVHKEIDFNKTGVQIVSYGTMKGLEFDAVILPRIEVINASNDHRVDMNRMYVATSRARTMLFLTYFNQSKKNQWIDTWSRVNPKKELFDWI